MNARLAFGGLLLLGLADLGLVNFKLGPELVEEQAKQASGHPPVVPDGPKPSPPQSSSVAVAPPQPTPEPPKTAEPPPSATEPAPPASVAAVEPAKTAPEPSVKEPPSVPEPPPSVATGDKPGTVSDIMFEIDSNLLKLSSKSTLDEVVSKLKADPNLRAHLRGHSDQLGSREHNLELSRTRAAGVENFLLMNGIAHSRITTEAVGGSKPADPSNTPAAWARNRRVEIEWR